MNPLLLATTAGHHLRALIARPFTRLLVLREGSGWILDTEAEEAARAAQRVGIPAAVVAPKPWLTHQCVHSTSQFLFANPRITRMSLRMSVDFLHGSSESHPHFRKALEALLRFSGDSLRVRVSNSVTERWVLSAGVPRNIVHRIPLGIRLEQMPLRTPALRLAARHHLGIPDGAFVVGSFQKDGVGWGAGMEPKPIKGPDIFLAAMAAAKDHIPGLMALLSGPARGYVMEGLRQMHIPFRHAYPKRPADMAPLYHALDAYCIASRDEGGPKALLEAFAAGVPLVSTRVGQVVDLATDGTDALLADIEDAPTLAAHLVRIAEMGDDELRRMTAAGHAVAERNAYEQQDGLWREFFNDHVIR